MHALQGSARRLVLLFCAGLCACLFACAAPSGEDDPPAPAVPGWERAVGPTWRLVAIDGATMIPGVEVTLAFDEAARASGHSGANRWFAQAEREGGDALTLGAVGSTKMFLADPPGVMEQEGLFFERLSRVRRYRIAGERLELLDAERVLLAFERG